MSTSKNGEVVLDFLKATFKGDRVRRSELLAKDAVFWTAGDLPMSGHHSAEESNAGAGKFFASLATPFTMNIGEITEEGEFVCFEAESHAVLTDGRAYNNQYHMMYQVRDGLIVMHKEYLDTLHFQEMFFPDASLEPSAQVRKTNLTAVTAQLAGPFVKQAAATSSSAVADPTASEGPTPNDNKEIVLRYLQASMTGDDATVQSALAADARFWTPGDMSISGYVTPEKLYADARAMFETISSPFVLNIGQVTAAEDRVCVEVESTASLSGSRQYNNQYHMLFKLRDGRIVLQKEYFDTFHVYKLFRHTPQVGGPRIERASNIERISHTLST
ncbi:MAG: nuclear transport factor 2 family protein [Caulobacteraceae bacterium]|nr:nuclear transport factor 2 family protein [Caulobacteraceae bacterium]